MSKIRQREFQHLLFYDKYGHVFRVYIFFKRWKFVKGVKEPSIQKLKVDKPSTRSEAEYGKKTLTNELSNHPRKWLRYI